MLLEEIINSKNINKAVGITSICSANKYVLKAAMQFEKKNNNKLLIESTSNQVDQFGGYTGMTPSDFVAYVKNIAEEVDFSFNNIIFGGDHLGPNVWQNESAESALKKAEDQIRAYVSAGFRKIHLDTSFPLGDDNRLKPLAPSIITKRAARLCAVAEEVYSKLTIPSEKPVYIIGTEVPIPGGAKEEEETISVTTTEDLEETIELSKNAFYEKGLVEAWERVIAVVVQPGVEFSDTKVFKYNRNKASKIKNKIEEYPNLVLEAHSTDYQSKTSLTEMVNDHFGILKVGPWLTFAIREAFFALAAIENELIDIKRRSNFRYEIDKVMKENPKYWKNHYHGTEKEIELARSFSYSDRIRYYWTNKKVLIIIDKLMKNLYEINIPNTLINQYLPTQYYQIMENKIKNDPESLVISKVTEVLKIYSSACGGNIEK
ncbi:MAG: D-tagatose-bisphosphate aldolase, class II, non-catalytic subunit [Bacteroidetes bacterium]|nr:D-tagatose-bisphosphate aldolase, class II, non-catalytic subunit [Bacteroidota bacterium]MBU1117053.1 D-tagatose-bisphosphate aldolase, class II, non-catalytic subunit [Bacteroidota bacterium]MBU1797648.1 D-tagatose-bisphosphate aldolase, class II, non-catalytic subunit [Bacteroidota bacterium]